MSYNLIILNNIFGLTKFMDTGLRSNRIADIHLIKVELYLEGSVVCRKYWVALELISVTVVTKCVLLCM